MQATIDLEAGLAQFSGTEHWYKHGLCRNFLYTDGVKYLAENAACYWLIDLIATVQPEVQRIHPDLREMQFWTLDVKPDKSAVLKCERDSDEIKYRYELEFTDFPLKQARIWVQRSEGVLLQGNRTHHNGATGIQIESLCRRVWLDGNTSYANSIAHSHETGIWLDETMDAVVQNNVVYDSYDPF